jgi:hypothetical protein
MLYNDKKLVDKNQEVSKLFSSVRMLAFLQLLGDAGSNYRSSNIS